tara:strand:+ start:541 stop:2232 length:1692 start_codon:yes stop_codon:yes gene_type:complete
MNIHEELNTHQRLLQYNSETESIQNIQEFFKITGHSRDYCPKDVATLRPRFPSEIPNYAMITSIIMRKKLSELCLSSNQFFASLVCLNPTQARAMAEACCFSDQSPLDGIYLSGWQEASSGENTYGAMFPDQSLYPVNSVPEKIKKIKQVLMAADIVNQHRLTQKYIPKESKKMFESINYHLPIIADLEAGFGQEIHTYQLAKSCIESGAACLHLEDQDGSLKKCGHMGGKVKVSVQDFKNKLKSVRLAADVLGTNTVIIGRTDALGTKLINNASDERDQPFLYYQLPVQQLSMHPYIIENEIRLDAWVLDLIQSKIVEKILIGNQSKYIILSVWVPLLDESRTSVSTYTTLVNKFSSTLGCTINQSQWLVAVLHNCQPLQTSNGFYRYNCNLESAIMVGKSIVNDVDLIWFETSEPDLNEAKLFANAIHSIHPTMQLHYNCSPSFNWKSNFEKYFGFNWESNLREFNHELAKLGYKSQKITLFGMHVTNQSIKEWVQEFQKNHMAGYSVLQEREHSSNNQSLEHQSFVGVDIWAHITELCQGKGSELVATHGDSATMDQFKQ